MNKFVQRAFVVAIALFGAACSTAGTDEPAGAAPGVADKRMELAAAELRPSFLGKGSQMVLFIDAQRRISILDRHTSVVRILGRMPGDVVDGFSVSPNSEWFTSISDCTVRIWNLRGQDSVLGDQERCILGEVIWKANDAALVSVKRQDRAPAVEVHEIALEGQQWVLRAEPVTKGLIQAIHSKGMIISRYPLGETAALGLRAMRDLVHGEAEGVPLAVDAFFVLLEGDSVRATSDGQLLVAAALGKDLGPRQGLLVVSRTEGVSAKCAFIAPPEGSTFMLPTVSADGSTVAVLETADPMNRTEKSVVTMRFVEVSSIGSAAWKDCSVW